MIRRRLIENLRAQNWTSVAIELVIVVVGILTALQITEWNDGRHDRLREHAYLVRIAADLDQSARDMEHSIRLSNEREQLGVLLMKSLDDAAVVRADPGRYMRALHQGAFTFSPEIRAHTFEEIKSVGDLGLFRDRQLLADITELYTDVRKWSQWGYIRELTQTEYMKRAAGILTYAEIAEVDASDSHAQFPVAQAMAARDRMLARPAFIEWLPTVANRADEVDTYRKWLARAKSIRVRIQARLDENVT